MSGISPATRDDISHALRVASISLASFTDTVAEMAWPASTGSMPSTVRLTKSTAAYVAECMLNPTFVHPESASLRNALRSSRSWYTWTSPRPELADSSSRMLTMTSRDPSPLTIAKEPSNVPEDCSVRYQNVESRKGSPSLTMTTASIPSALEMSLSALDSDMPLQRSEAR